MQIIGIVGTAKNTGKTTALTSILDSLSKNEFSLGVTSIGYDGEDIDNLTFLPKPRIFLKEGVIIASSSLTFETSKIKYEILYETDIYTPLGKVIIAKVLEPGKIVLAGPNNIKDLKKIIALFKTLNTDFLFVDGAMNRMAPMYLADKVIFSTGASRSTEIKNIVEEISLISLIFNKNIMPQYDINSNCFFVKNGELLETEIKSLLTKDDLLKLFSYRPENYEKVVIKNIFSSAVVKEFVQEILKKKDTYETVFLEPFRLLLSMNDISISEFRRMFTNNINISFIYKPSLIAITVNSFYPKYENFHFTAGYIDKYLLKKSVSEGVTVPVFDIFEEGSIDLVKLLF